MDKVLILGASSFAGSSFVNYLFRNYKFKLYGTYNSKKTLISLSSKKISVKLN